MNYQQNKKICRFGRNCNRRQICRYFHQNQQLYDDASLSMKRDQIKIFSKQQKDQYGISNVQQKLNKANYNYNHLNGHNRHRRHNDHHNHFNNHDNNHNRDNHYKHDNHDNRQIDNQPGINHSFKVNQQCNKSCLVKQQNLNLNVQGQNQKQIRGRFNCKQKGFDRNLKIKRKDKLKISSQSGNDRSSSSLQQTQKQLSRDTKHILQKQANQQKYIKKLSQDELLYQRYYQACSSFFNRHRICQAKRAKIIQYLIVFAPLSIVQDVILSSVDQLQNQGFINYFNYKKMIKMFCKKNYDIQQTRRTLLKKVDIQSKKRQKDYEFQQRFPSPKIFQFLQSQDLVINELQDQNTIYLVDGNNCLPTQKHMRSFFQAKQSQKKVQAQCRFKWLLSLALNPQRIYLFFDNQYDQSYYELFKKAILHQIEYEQYEKVNIIFPKQNQNADKAIIRQLKQLQGKKQNKKIVLVTGDKVLTQQCLDICPVMKSSGLYFIKFLKKMLKRKQDKQQSKKILKRIFNYGN